MKRALTRIVLFTLLIAWMAPGCSEINEASSGNAKITVFVHWGNSPIQGKKVEVLQTGKVKFTNEKGVVELAVQPGRYTVRVHEINRGGPCCSFVDLDVAVTANETRTLDVVDCLPCV